MKTKDLILIIIAISILIFSSVRIFRSLTETPTTSTMDSYYDQVEAELLQGLQHINPKTTVVALIFDTEINSRNNAPLECLLDTLKASTKVKHVERLKINKHSQWNLQQPGFPYEEYKRVAAKYNNVDAIVSLCGVPYGKDEIVFQDSTLPPLMVLRPTEYTAHLQALLEEGIISLAVINHAMSRSNQPQKDLAENPIEVFIGTNFQP